MVLRWRNLGREAARKFNRGLTNDPAARRTGRAHRGLIYKELAHTLPRREGRDTRGDARTKCFLPIWRCAPRARSSEEELSDTFHRRGRRGRRGPSVSTRGDHLRPASLAWPKRKEKTRITKCHAQAREQKRGTTSTIGREIPDSRRAGRRRTRKQARVCRVLRMHW